MMIKVVIISEVKPLAFTFLTFYLNDDSGNSGFSISDAITSRHWFGYKMLCK